QEELKKERDQKLHSFTGILSRVDGSGAVALVAPLQSATDFNLHQYAAAEPLMLDTLENFSREPRTLQDPTRCARSKEFLATVAELMDAALDGQKAPFSRCYVYDAQENTLAVESVSTVAALPVQLHGPNNKVLLDTSYDHLLQLDFVSTHKLTGKRVYFSIL